jgi:DNA end-binding protein Ku
MKAIWKGAISFGLVNIPVRLYSAIESDRPGFHLLYKKDLSRIRYKRVSETTGQEVPFDQIVRGFPLDNDRYVTISDEELEQASPEKSATLDIQAFVPENQIESLYFDRPYYLEPEKSAAKPYALLREALGKSGKVGICQFVLRDKEHLSALKIHGEVMVLNSLRFAGEIRATTDLALPQNQVVSQKEVSLAERLIEELSEDFKPEHYKDTYSEDLKKLIDAKAKGQKIKAAAKKPTQGKVVDLMAALQESLKKTKKRAA